MRTTVDLPDDVHRSAVQIARDRHQTLSRTVGDLLRVALTPAATGSPVAVDPDTGFPLVSLDTRITADDVARAQDE